MSSHMSKYLSVVPYEAPEWARQLKRIPKERVVLAALPTPIHKWNIPNLPNGFEVHIKRDDMTGSSLSGNKVRKLEFLLAEAIAQGCKSVITCGSIQSNHCRATAIAARELNLDCHLFLRTNKTDEEIIHHPGNLLTSLLCNSNLYFIPKGSQYIKDIKPKQDILMKKLREETGHLSFPIPIGGSNNIGLFGYINAWEEMISENNIFEEFLDIVMACGSGGTVAGLAIANYLTGQRLKIHGITVADNKEYLYGYINEMLITTEILDVKAEDIADIIDDYKGSGYGISTGEDRELYTRIASTTGIICDPVYTGKAVKGMLSELENNPTRFKGKKVLFIHTGGIYSLFDGTVQPEIKQQFRKNAYLWSNDSTTYTSLF